MNKVYLDPAYKGNLDLIKKQLYKNYDWFMIFSGRERSGKSTFAIQTCAYIDPNFNIDKICFSIDEYLTQIKKAKRGDAILFDEAGTNLFSREAVRNINRAVIKTIMITGIRNVFIAMCLPSFFYLDSYIRDHRVNNLIYLPKRSYFRAFSQKKTKLLSIKGYKNKDHQAVKWSIHGRCTKQFPSDQLEKDYNKKKERFVNKFLRDIKDDLSNYYRVTKFAEVTGYNTQTIYRWIKEKKIKTKRIGASWFIPKTEAERIGEIASALKK